MQFSVPPHQFVLRKWRLAFWDQLLRTVSLFCFYLRCKLLCRIGRNQCWWPLLTFPTLNQSASVVQAGTRWKKWFRLLEHVKGGIHGSTGPITRLSILPNGVSGKHRPSNRHPKTPHAPNDFCGWRNEALVEATLLKPCVGQSVCLVHFIRRFMAALGGLFATQSLFNQFAPPALTFITSPCHSLQGHAKYHQIFMILITAFRKESGGERSGEHK